jgi:hypothetical protein
MGNVWGQNVEKSIVKIESVIGGKPYEGIGFAWLPPNAKKVCVVTALHVVAGGTITLRSADDNKPLGEAIISRFLRKADLALLEPTGVLKIPALALYGGASSAKGKVWGIKEQRVISRDMALGEKKPLVTKLFERERSPKQEKLPALTDTDVLKYFSPQNYPGKVDVLSLAAPVREGDSGSPITVNGQAVSMVDGGLDNLPGIKKAWWSIPLKANLAELSERGETDVANLKPYTGENGLILFRKPRSENKPVTYKKREGGAVDFSLYHVDQVTFGEVYHTMLPEDKSYIEDALNDEHQVSIDKLSPETIDVYEDYASGATFGIPTMLSDDLEIDQDAGHTFVEAFSQFSEHSRSYVKLIVSIDKGGLRAKDSFKGYILSGEALNDDDWGGEDWHDVHWVKEEHSDDDVVNDLHDPKEPYYHEIMERTYKQGDQGGEVYSSMTINQNGVFLGVAIIVNDPSSLEGDDLLSYYLMEACMTMAGFPYE